MISYILAIIVSLSVLALDFLTKYLVKTNFALGESRPFIDGLLNFVYIHNEGAAWGILSGKRVVLLVVTITIMAACVFFLIKYARHNKLLFWAVSLVLSGGIGNMYDRFFRNGKVIDFLQFDFWQSFPVFNVADCAIVVGAGLLILYFILDMIKDYKEKKINNANN